MAIQRGVIKLSGKLDDMVFYAGKDKYLAKSAATKCNQTEGTIKSSSDFGRSHPARSLIEEGFRPLIDAAGDGSLDNRLKSVTIKLVNTGPAHLKGKRKMTDGDIAMLRGFEFNAYTSVNSQTGCQPSVHIDPAGDITITLPAMQTGDMFYAPTHATHAVLQFRCCSFFFEQEECYFAMPEDLVIPLKKDRFPGGEVSLAITETEEVPDDYVVMIAWTIQFIAADGDFIRDRRYYAGSILQSVYIKDGQIVVFQYPEPVKKEQPVNQVKRAAWKMGDNG